MLELEQLLKEFKDLKGIPPKLTQHKIELDNTTPSVHQARYKLNLNNDIMFYYFKRKETIRSKKIQTIINMPPHENPH